MNKEGHGPLFHGIQYVSNGTTGHRKERTEMYAVKYQREGTSRYVCEEMDSVDEFIQCIVDTAQLRGKGWKYRLMELSSTDDNGIMARFDVQYTKVN